MKYLLIASLSLAGLASAQNPQQEKGSIEGRVTNALSGEGLKKTEVTANLVGAGAPISTTTGTDGSYALTGLAPGKYMLFANRNGFVRQGYGTKGSNRSPLQISVAAGGKRSLVSTFNYRPRVSLADAWSMKTVIP